MSGVSGKFFHLTIEEKPAAHALDRELGRRAWDASLALAGLAAGTDPPPALSRAP